MKKTFKRAGVAVLSMAMLMSMGAIGSLSASALDSNTDKSIVINGQYKGVYKVYKVLDAAVNVAGTAYTYTYVTGFGNNGYTPAQIAAVSASNATDMKTLADTLVTDATSDSVFDNTPAIEVATADCSSGSNATVGSLDPGYYLIVCDSGTQMKVAPMLVPLDSENSPYNVTPKTSSIAVDKNITGVAQGTASAVTGSKDGNANSNTAQVAVGNVVSYEILTTIPSYASTVNSLAQPFKIIDTADSGLSVDTSSIKVYVDADNDNTYASGEEVTSDTTTTLQSITSSTSGFTVQFKDAYVLTQANQGLKVKVTFNASVTAAALTKGDGTNVGKISFDNDYYTAGSAYPTELTDTTEVYTAKFQVTKTFSDDPSSGSYPVAGFTLHKDSASGTVIGTEILTTSTNKVIEFTELAAGTYCLVETTTPAGYHTAPNVTFTVGASTDGGGNYTGTYTITSGTPAVSGDNVITQTVSNTKGDTLPGTGGIGTTLFTVGGAAVVLLAGFMFVIYMRKRRLEE